MQTVLFSAPDATWSAYAEVLPKAFAQAGIDAQVTRDAPPDTVDFIVYAPNETLVDFSPYTNARAVLSLWAGVERIVGNASLTQPLCRMVDAGLALGMRDYVLGHVLRHHIGLDPYINGTARGWVKQVPPLARDRTVGVLGLGELGAACASAIAAAGFNTLGWSRREKSLANVTCLHGDAGLAEVLAAAEILVLLLPDTPATTHIMNATRLAQMPSGAVIINPGRGTLIDDDALLHALDRGQIDHATLDVFQIEPLPEAHPYWTHPKVTVTPHIAAETRPHTAAEVIVENMRRTLAGEPLLHLVDRTLGY